MFKKIASLTLVFALLLSLGCSASAAVPRTESASFASSVLKFSGTDAQCSIRVRGKTGTTRMEIEVSLQTVNADGSYTTEVSWPRTVYSDEFSLDTTVSYRSSGDYRLLVEATVYGASGNGEPVSAVSYATCN